MTVIYLKLGGCSRSEQVKKEGGLVNVNIKIVFSEVSIPSRLLGYDLVKCCVLMSLFESFDCVQSQQSLL